MAGPRRAFDEAAPPGDAAGAQSDSAASRNLPPVRIRDLTKRFGAVTAVDGLSFEVTSGRVTGFLGPNGAGKTTTLRVLVGLTAPTAGSATFGDRTYAELPTPQQTVGCVLEANFHPGRSGRNHLRVLAATAGVGDDRVDEMLALVGLTEAARRPVGGYSMGMRQRLALAAALLGDPDYLLLDEPANGLDPEGIRWLRTFLRTYAGRGRTVLVSSHLLSEVEATVDDIVVISHGRLLKQAKMADLNISEGSVRLRARHPDQAQRALAEMDLETALLRDDHGPFLRVRTMEPATVGAVLFEAGICVYELSRERYDLEERFFAMLEGDSR